MPTVSQAYAVEDYRSGKLRNVDATEASTRDREEAKAMMFTSPDVPTAVLKKLASKAAADEGFKGAVKDGAYDDGTRWVSVGRAARTEHALEDLAAKYGLDLSELES